MSSQQQATMSSRQRTNRRTASAAATNRARVTSPAPIKVMTSSYDEVTRSEQLAEVVDTSSCSAPSTSSDSSLEKAASPHAASFPVLRPVPAELASPPLTRSNSWSSKEAAPIKVIVNSYKEVTKLGLAQVVDTGSWSAPSAPSDSSSDEATSSPHAASFPVCRPVPVLASLPSTRSDSSSEEEVAPIVMMNSNKGMTTKLEQAEVMDTSSWSAPSTPSDSSSDEAMSPHAARFPVCRPVPVLTSPSQLKKRRHAASVPRLPVVYGAVRGLALSSSQQMPSVSCVEMRQVWNHNFAEEATLIESLLDRFRYVAVDTEFPGTVYLPASPVYLLTTEKRYALLKANVDELHLIQLGLTLFNTDGASITWEFNLSDFDVRRHGHAPESIAMLRAMGVDLDRTRRHGVRAAMLGTRLRKWLRAGLGRAGVVTFSGGYDVAYLLKLMFGSGYKLPATAAELLAVSKSLLGKRNLFDIKEMVRRCPGDLRGGLECVAAKLNVTRGIGNAHQAGSDSLLTCHIFIEIKERHFHNDDKLNTVAGMVTDIRTFSSDFCKVQ